VRAFREQQPSLNFMNLVRSDATTLSFEHQTRKPSPTLLEAAANQFADAGCEPSDVLVVSHQFTGDLDAAKRRGFRTALLVADANAGTVDKETLRDAETRPDRLLTSIPQILDIVG
jgi:FMN phosphatase YigB (HAD superfamily)